MSETWPPQPPPLGELPEPDETPASPTLLDRLAANTGIRLAVLLGFLAWAAVANIWLFVIIMALVVSIFLHELGHYLVAKRNGMKVTEFFIGFGPRIWSFRRGETEYGVKLIWLGAYVKIIGMSNLEDVDAADEPRSYRSQSFGKRMPVVLAGPAMNLLLGFLLLVVVIAGFGRESDTSWDVRSISPGSAAAAAGLEPGDRFVAFDGQPVEQWSEFVALAQAHAGTEVDITVERGGQTVVVPVSIGWSLTEASARQLGLEEGDRIASVNGQPVPLYADLVGTLQNADGPVTVGYSRIEKDGTVDGTVEVTGPIELVPDGSKGQVGITKNSVVERVSLLQAFPDAASQFGTMVSGSVEGMGRLFSPSGIGNLFHQVATAQDDPATPSASSSSSGSSGASSSAASSGSSSENADRPMSILGIVNVGAQIGDEGGWAGVLALLAMVNIFLGLINLVPLLPLDGGHIAVACYEEIRSRLAHRPYRVNMAKLMPVTYVVILLMLGLGLSTIYLDAVKPISIR